VGITTSECRLWPKHGYCALAHSVQPFSLVTKCDRASSTLPNCRLVHATVAQKGASLLPNKSKHELLCTKYHHPIDFPCNNIMSDIGPWLNNASFQNSPHSCQWSQPSSPAPSPFSSPPLSPMPPLLLPLPHSSALHGKTMLVDTMYHWYSPT
jgi:hypothetical protein